MSSGFLSLFPVDLPDHFLELRARAHDLAPAAEAAELEVRADAQHPCGEKRWEVLRIGADFKLRCLGCGREVMGPRAKFEKMVRQIDRKEG